MLRDTLLNSKLPSTRQRPENNRKAKQSSQLSFIQKGYHSSHPFHTVTFHFIPHPSHPVPQLNNTASHHPTSSLSPRRNPRHPLSKSLILSRSRRNASYTPRIWRRSTRTRSSTTPQIVNIRPRHERQILRPTMIRNCRRSNIRVRRRSCCSPAFLRCGMVSCQVIVGIRVLLMLLLLLLVEWGLLILLLLLL